MSAFAFLKLKPANYVQMCELSRAATPKVGFWLKSSVTYLLQLAECFSVVVVSANKNVGRFCGAFAALFDR